MNSQPAQLDHTGSAVPDDLSWLSGGGEMGELIRSMDWSATPLGPVQHWPQSLRTSVSLCLSSTFPILVAWGPDDIQIYNDAYRPICGAKHPESMGAPFKVCWETALPVVGGAFDRAHGGEGVYIRDQRMFLDRYGYLEEAFMTFSFSPIRVESGEVGGIFHPITESTAQVLNARRTQSLRDLTAGIGEARTVAELGLETASQHARHAPLALDLPFLMLYQFDADSGALRLCAASGLDDAAALAPPHAQIGEAGGWPFAQALQTMAAQRCTVPAAFGAYACEPYPQAPSDALVLPVTVAGQAQPFGFVVAGVSACRALDADYLHFYDMLAAAFSTAIGNVLAYEQEQRRAAALAEIDRAKTAFFSNVSHEFRTPLTLILGPLDDALADTEEPLGPRQRNRIDVTNRNALRLLKLVNSLLDFSRIEAGRVQASYTPVDLALLTADLASVFTSAMEKGGLTYTVQMEPLGDAVYVDHDMWEKIVFNLLSNAFKFTLHGSVAVDLRRCGERARLTVRDTGTGVAADELPRLFERFHRIEGTQGRTYEGTGIGLALIQELIKLHGGTIAVVSEPGVGTEFTVELPFGSSHLPPERIAAQAPQPAYGRMGAAFVEEALHWLPDEAPADVPENGDAGDAGAVDDNAAGAPRIARKPVIVVADDNSDMRAYIKSLLERDAIVETCADGEAAYAAILRRMPDLLVSDVMMPHLDGFGLIAKIRANADVKDLPIMLLSARAGEEAKVEGLQAGADDYIVKPFAANELLARVQAQLELLRRRRDANDALREREAYFRDLVDTSPAILWITDADHQCTYLSQRWYDYTGREPQQDLGLGWLGAVHRDDVERTRTAFIDAASQQLPFIIDYRLRDRDGEYRWMIDAGMPRRVEGGSAAGYVGTVFDIHERKMLAAELSQANRLQREFLVTLAHELRNPLAPIRSGLEVMRTAHSGNAATDKIRAMMERQVAHLVHLVDDLLDLARIAQGKDVLQRAPALLADVVAMGVEISMPLIEGKQHRFDVSVPAQPVPLDVDAHRIAQVIGNLLNNAAKYTPAHGAIALRAAIGDGMLDIAVSDNGIGIADTAIGTVFELYTQVAGSERHAQGGLGIGLNLVRRLVELHGGTVHAASAGAGQGSTFSVRLPLLQSVSPEQAQQPEREPAAAATGMADAGAGAVAAGLRILVVDDNGDAADSLAALLEILGHTLAVVHDGEQALARAAQFRPDAVFLDLGLPGISGYDVARALRAMPELDGVTLAALTGWGGEADRQRTREAGFDHHLTKPVGFDAMTALLGAVVPRQPG